MALRGKCLSAFKRRRREMRRRSIALVVILVAVALISTQSVFAQDKEPASTPAAPEQSPQASAPAPAPKQAPAAATPSKRPAGEQTEALKKAQAKASVAADSDSYVIGPEDVLFIYVWKEENLSRTVPVRMDGMISIPLVDDIKAAGMTPLQLKQTLLAKLSEFVETPDVTVIVTEANSYKVYVQGEVKTPGVYKLRTETSLVQLIVMAGGFTDWADKKKITIIRKEGGKESRIRANYKKIIDGDEGAKDIILKSGDIVIIPN
jgi:polysaccharide export outer membrane protein